MDQALILVFGTMGCQRSRKAIRFHFSSATHSDEARRSCGSRALHPLDASRTGEVISCDASERLTTVALPKRAASERVPIVTRPRGFVSSLVPRRAGGKTRPHVAPIPGLVRLVPTKK